jgi:hypothetical protein
MALLNGEPIDLGMIEVKQTTLVLPDEKCSECPGIAITPEPKGGSDRDTTTPIAAVSNL